MVIWFRTLSISHIFWQIYAIIRKARNKKFIISIFSISLPQKTTMSKHLLIIILLMMPLWVFGQGKKANEYYKEGVSLYNTHRMRRRYNVLKRVMLLKNKRLTHNTQTIIAQRKWLRRVGPLWLISYHTIGIEYMPDDNGNVFSEKYSAYRL